MKTILFSLILIWVNQAPSSAFAFRRTANPKILGGEEAVPHSIPFQVAISSDEYTVCGGSLISDKWVLTSAQCVLAVSGNPKVILGAHDINNNEEEDTQVIITGSNTIAHEEYNEEYSYRNDIGLVELSEAVPLNENIQTVALPSRNEGAHIGELAQASGWDEKETSRLKYYNASIISNVQCQNLYGSPTVVFMTKLCIDGNEDSSICSGDYGGPLVIRDNDGNFVQIGIATAINFWAGCSQRYPQAFTRVSSYIDWIEKRTGINME